MAGGNSPSPCAIRCVYGLRARGRQLDGRIGSPLPAPGPFLNIGDLRRALVIAGHLRDGPGGHKLANVIVFHYTPALGDVTAVSRIGIDRSIVLWIGRKFALFNLAGFCALAVVATVQGGGAALIAMTRGCAPTIIVFGVFALLPQLTELFARLQLRSRALPSAPVSGQVSDEGFVLTSEGASVTYVWRDFKEVLETRTHFLIALRAQPKAFRVIPKRAFGSKDDLKGFIAIINANAARGTFALPIVGFPFGKTLIGILAVLIPICLVVLYALLAQNYRPR